MYTISNYSMKYGESVDLSFVHKNQRQIDIKIHDPRFFVQTDLLTIPSAKLSITLQEDAALYWCLLEGRQEKCPL